jgi:hypothetical protein
VSNLAEQRDKQTEGLFKVNTATYRAEQALKQLIKTGKI